MASIAFFECSRCGQHLSPETPPTTCPADGSPLLVRYHLPSLHNAASPADPAHLPSSGTASLGVDRVHDLLPTSSPRTPSGLGEGSTPLLRSRTHLNLFLKDEGRNPCGTVAARGFALAIPMARHNGVSRVALATADPLEATACAAFAAAFGLHAHIIMPRSSSFAAQPTPQLYGAETSLLNAPFETCAARAKERSTDEHTLDLSAGQEPFRLEGTKTLLFELLDQLAGQLPAAILLPPDPILILATAKALDELSAIGRLAPAAAPVTLFAVASPGPSIPGPLADLAQTALSRSGRLLRPSPETSQRLQQQTAHTEGLFLSPAGAATVALYEALLASGDLLPEHRTIAINPADGLLALALDQRRPLPTSLPVGGIITPV